MAQDMILSTLISLFLCLAEEKAATDSLSFE